ncbi:MAG TPA: arylsulfotransferase family protein [Gemmatimonadaceae bacterium]|nr:arylsulfotransferase family protein [Gemmatimonadaceae bacterium]
MSPTGVRDRALAAALTLVVSMGCDRDAVVAPTPPPPPEILASAVAANPGNVLSAMVTAEVRFADSIAVHYGLAGGTLEGAAPAVVPIDGSVLVPVLGLRADTRYDLQIVAYGGGEPLAGPVLELLTGTLPEDLPHYTASGPDPSPGFVVFAAGPYGLVIDNAGRVAWYHRFEHGPGLNFMVQPTGRYTARPLTGDPTDPAPWVEIDPRGDTTRTFACARDLQPRFHDLIGLPDHSYWIMCDETRVMDLSALGGSASARVTGTVIQHVSAGGGLLFQWSPFDHFAIADLDAASRGGESVNWTHGNALDLDVDGNLVASFRNLGEITKIDTRTGEIVWRLGGRRNEFTIEGEVLPPFAGQHGVRVTGAGSLLLLDNLGDPVSSRVERYALDEVNRTARLAAFYDPSPSVIASLGGTTQSLSEGRTLVAYGSGGRVEEYDAEGRIVWRIEGNPGYIFRVQRIHSLYQPGVGSPR